MKGYGTIGRGETKDLILGTDVANYVGWKRLKTIFSMLLVMFCKHDQYVAEAIF